MGRSERRKNAAGSCPADLFQGLRGGVAHFGDVIAHGPQEDRHRLLGRRALAAKGPGSAAADRRVWQALLRYFF